MHNSATSSSVTFITLKWIKIKISSIVSEQILLSLSAGASLLPPVLFNRCSNCWSECDVCLQGEMTISAKFGGDPISKSPFTVGVAAPLDLSKVTVDNLDGSKTPVILCFRPTYGADVNHVNHKHIAIVH